MDLHLILFKDTLKANQTKSRQYMVGVDKSHKKNDD